MNLIIEHLAQCKKIQLKMRLVLSASIKAVSCKEVPIRDLLKLEFFLMLNQVAHSKWALKMLLLQIRILLKTLKKNVMIKMGFYLRALSLIRKKNNLKGSQVVRREARNKSHHSNSQYHLLQLLLLQKLQCQLLNRQELVVYILTILELTRIKTS